MAPEQWDRGAVTAASDQFAFAVTLWELLTGKRPYRGDSEAEIRAAWKQAPVLAKPIARHVEVALRRALSPQAADRWPAMEPLLVELSRDPARTRRRVIAIAAASLVLAGGGALVASRAPRVEEQPCADVLASFTTAEQRRAALPILEDDRVTPKLDVWMKQWRTSRLAACEDTHVRRTQPVAVLELRELCFDRARTFVEGSLSELLTATDRAPLIEALPKLDECNDVTAMRNAAPLPADPAARAEITAINADLATVRVHRTAGRPKEALALIEQLAPRAAATGWKALEAETLMVLANVRIGNGNTAVRELFERAAKLAAEALDDRLLAKAWLNHLDLLIARLRKPADAERMIPVVEAAVLRAGNTAELREDMLATFADIDQEQDRVQLARERYEQAIALHTSEDSELARKLNRLAGICNELEDYDAARAHLTRSAQVLERAYGPKYRHLGVVWTTLGEVEFRAGNHAEARRVLERAIAHKEALDGPRSFALIPTLMDLASVRQADSELVEAEALMVRAVEIGRATVGIEHPLTMESARWLVGVLLAQHKFRAAEKLLAEVVPLAYQHEHTGMIPLLELDLARVHLAANRLGEARKAVERARAKVPPTSHTQAKALLLLGDIEDAAGHGAAASEARNQAQAIMAEH
jgi:tetratricopeptide (TPR) repeat protein